MVKIKRKRGMINPTEFDEPSVGRVADKASDMIGGVAETISDKAKLYDATHGSDRPRPTDFDENPPKKLADRVKETTSSISDRVSTELNKEPQTPYPPEANFGPQINPSDTTWSGVEGPFFDQTKGDKGKNIPDNQLPSTKIRNPDGSFDADFSAHDETLSEKTKKVVIEKGKEIIVGAKNIFEDWRNPKSNFNSNIQDEDNLLKFNMSDSEVDRLAALCGSTKSVTVLRQEYNELKDQRKVHESTKRSVEDKRESFRSEKSKLRSEYDTLNSDISKIKDRQKTAKDDVEKASLEDQLKAYVRKRSNVSERYEEVTSVLDGREDRYRLSQKEEALTRKWESLMIEISSFKQKVNCGSEKEKKSKSWRMEAKNFSDNAQSLLGAPKVNDISQQVGYGGMTGQTAVAGINAITGGYKVRDEANSWTRTNVGDRQLVESLVNVKPNRMITPFGVPGTVGESNLSSQFNYSSPLRKIGVGDVTARGGYQINIEDIHRRKQTTQPALLRKKLAEKKLAKERKKLAEQRALAESKKIINKKVIRSSMSVENKGIASAAGFLNNMRSPVFGMKSNGIKTITKNANIAVGITASLKPNKEPPIKEPVKSNNTIAPLKGLSSMGGMKGLTIGNFSNKGIKAITDNIVIVAKKKKVTK